MKQHAPATLRNREPILAVLREVLPAEGVVLELGSGTGEHAVYFAAALPALRWQPSDLGDAALASIAAHREEASLANLAAPIRIDLTQDDWGVRDVAAMVCANVLHISPWAACQGLMRGAGRLLAPGAPLCTYGPYRFSGEFTAPSNAEFDASLRARDPSWGVRDVDDVVACAAEHGLRHTQTHALPANNHVLVFRR